MGWWVGGWVGRVGASGGGGCWVGRVQRGAAQVAAAGLQPMACADA